MTTDCSDCGARMPHHDESCPRGPAMTTPTADADLLQGINNILSRALMSQNLTDPTDIITKVRALLSEGESAKVRDESSLLGALRRIRSAVGAVDDTGDESHALNVIMDEADRALAGYAPQGAPPEDE